MTDNFVYVTLASNDPTVLAGDTNGSFSNTFTEPIELGTSGRVEVALVSLSWVPPTGTKVVFVNSDLVRRTVQIGSQRTQELVRLSVDGSGPYSTWLPSFPQFVPCAVGNQINGGSLLLTDENGDLIVPHASTTVFATLAIRAAPSRHIGNL